GPGHCVQRREVFWKALPLPPNAVSQSSTGDVLDTLHQADQPTAPLGPDRGKADSTVSHHHSRDAVPTGWREPRIPGGLPIVMSMNVDPTGCYQKAVSVQDPTGPRGDLTHFTDQPALNGNVSVPSLASRPINNGSAADNEVVHGRALPL